MGDLSVLGHEPRGQPADDGSSVASRRPASPRRRTRPVPLIARAVLGTALVALCAVAVWWWASGGTWLTVRTPSMGRAAPVGTLLWVKPSDIRDVHVGDVVTFHTPTVGNQAGVTSPPIKLRQQTYTHRVVGRFPDGALQTKGDLNAGTDPWHTDQQHLVGRVSASWRGAGWLVRALPLLILGGIAWWVITGLLASRRSRAPLRVLGAAGLVAGAIYLFNPLFGVNQRFFAPLGPQGARATYVGTGLMPLKLEAEGAPPEVVHLGEEQSIMTDKDDQSGRYQVNVVPTIPWQTWPIVAGACLLPAVWSVIVGVDAPPPRQRRRRRGQRRSPPTVPEAQPS
jgi:hypothetical protein